MRIAAAWGLMLSAAPALAQASPRAAFDRLLAVDRAFAAAAEGRDLVSALTAMFDRHVVMMSGPALIRNAGEAKTALLAKPGNADARITWAPAGGGLSADGRHGFTYGLMTMRRADGSTAPLKYLAYWVRRPEGWRVAAYKRLTRPAGEPPMPLAPGPILPERLAEARPAPPLEAVASLKAAESAFSDEAQLIGLRAAFARRGRADSINLGTGPGFAIGAEAISQAVAGPEPGSPVIWGADGVLVASSGDLGLSYGMLHRNGPVPEGKPAAFPFFTIWWRPNPSAPWRYVAE